MEIQPSVDRQEQVKDAFMRCFSAESKFVREQMLEQLGIENPEIEAEVRSLLSTSADAGAIEQVFGFASHEALAETNPSGEPNSTPTGHRSSHVIAEGPGTLLGPYKLLEQIGEGGMGSVFMAQQSLPIKRRVALKIIKPGMDTQQVIARFEAERQALALMDHPNIAKVLDAGTTQHGRPYFVMELVKGIPITEYCSREKLKTKDRLRLFIDLCHGVQHAHQKGIIHRDLKPSNVLVTLHDSKPIVKIIDFGIAKAINQELTDRTLFTHFSQMIGTPLYMSPEQADLSGLDVDTRSDVYSLGVLLYELLTGTTPFDKELLKGVGLDEIRRMIRETEPPRPSQRVGQNTGTLKAANDSTLRVKLKPNELRAQRELKGELDWIVMKALEKERNRRYESPSAFAADVERYLFDEPVMACPPSAAYRFSKFLRKNRIAIGTTFLVSVATFLGLIGTAWQASRAWNAEKTALSEARIAKLESANAQAISDFFLKDILAQSDPVNQIQSNHIADPNIKLRTVLDRASKSVAERFSTSPIVEGNIHYTIGQAYMSIGLFDQAEEHLLRCIEIGRNTTGLMENPGTARAIGMLGQLRIEQDRLNEAEPLIIESYELLKRRVNEDSEDVRMAQGRLVVLRFEQNRFEEALKLAISLEQQCTKFLGETSLPTLAARHNVANQYSSLGLRREAMEILQRNLDLKEQLLGKDHPETLSSMRNLAACFNNIGKHAEAIELFESVLESDRKIFGVDHNMTLMDQSQLGYVLQEHSRFEEGEKLLAPALEKLTENLGFDHKSTLTAASYLASLYSNRNQHQKAFDLRKSIHAARLDKLGIHHRETITSKNNIADSLSSLDRKSEAAQEWLVALKCAMDSLGEEDDLTLLIMNNLGTLHQKEGRLKESYELFEKVYEKRHKKFGPNEYSTLLSAFNLAFVSNRLGRYADAIVLLEKSLGNMVESLGRDHSLTLRALTDLGYLYRLEASIPNRFEKAESLHRQVFESNVRLFGLHHENTRKAMEDVVLAMLKQDKESNARQFVQQQIDRATADNGVNSIEDVAIEESAGAAFQKESKLEFAITLFGQAYENRTILQGADHRDTQSVFEKLVALLHFEKAFSKSLTLVKQRLADLKELDDVTSPATERTSTMLADTLRQLSIVDDKGDAGLLFDSVLALGNGVNPVFKTQIDGQGNRFVTGSFEGTVDFDPNQSHVGDTDILSSLGSGTDAYVAKYDSTGSLLWARRMGSPTSDFSSGLAVDRTGNVYVTGGFYGTADFGGKTLTSLGEDDDVFLVRLSASGQVDWATNQGTPDSILLEGIAFGNENAAVYLSGATVSRLPHLSRFNAENGSMVWERTLEGVNYASEIATDEQGNLFLIDSFYRTFDVDPGPGVHIINPTKNGIDMKNTAGMFVLKLNGNGEFDWAKVIQSGETPSSYFLSSDVAIDNRGNVLIVGSYGGIIDFDPSVSGVAQFPVDQGNRILLKLDNEGEYLWAQAFKGGSGSEGAQFSHVTVDTADNIYLAGINRGVAIDFDTSEASALLTPSNPAGTGLRDGFLVSLTSAGQFRWANKVGGIGGDVLVHGVDVSKSNQVAFSGRFRGSVDFDPNSGTQVLSSVATSAMLLTLNPTPGVTVSRTKGVVTSEAGRTASVELSLDSAPTADVTLSVACDDLSEGSLSVSSLTFTSANWNVPQVVRVSGVNDSVVDGDTAYTIDFSPAVSTDHRYNGIQAASVSVTNLDDDLLPVPF